MLVKPVSGFTRNALALLNTLKCNPLTQSHPECDPISLRAVGKMRRPKTIHSLLLSFLTLQGTLHIAKAGEIMKTSSNSIDASDSSGWRKLANGSYVRVYGNQDAMAASETQGSYGGESSDTRDVSVLRVDSGWVELPNGTWAQEGYFNRYINRYRPRSTTSRPFHRSRSSSSALDSSDVVVTSRAPHKASTRPVSYTHLTLPTNREV